MSRAALLIGVSQSGDLPKLQAVEDGVAHMTAWAHSQDDMSQIVPVTDAKDPVTIDRLLDEVDGIMKAGAPEQLVVYFAGHGFSKTINEFWLLSKAPKRTHEAVDLTSSSELARTLGIPHVVFISDACRTAPEGINAQAVEGSPMFENGDAFGTTWVDRYYATRPGDPALEIKDKDTSVERYSSLYTTVFVRALLGKPSTLLVPAPEKDEAHLLTWTLSENLPDLVVDELKRRKLDLKLTQAPQARIESGSVGLISRVDLKRAGKLTANPRGAEAIDITEQTNRSLRYLLEGHGAPPPTADIVVDRFTTVRSASGAPDSDDADRLVATTRQLSLDFGAAHHETGTGMKVRGGNTIVEVQLTDGMADWWPEGARTQLPNGVPAANSLVRFASGHLAVIPQFYSWLAALTFDDVGTNLVAVDFEPMDYHPRWDEIADTIEAQRSVRAFVAAASREGVFSPTDPVQDDLDRWLTQVDGLDPTLAMYRAYAQSPSEAGNPARSEAEKELGPTPAGLEAALFDLVMLSDRQDAAQGGAPGQLAAATMGNVFPAFPMLTQGWPLQRVYGPALPPSLHRLGEHLASSHWTLFEPTAEPLLLDAFSNGEL